MKKLINRPGSVVEEMVEGLVAVYPGLRRVEGRTVVVRADAREEASRSKVALDSRRRSGHEPARGYAGSGSLLAAPPSPAPDAVLAAIEAVAGRAGALLIVKNYTGDRLNFGLAADLARAEGIPVETVVVADDAALAASSGLAGARGLAGTIFVHKVAGAASEAGLSLAEVAAEARATASAVATMGVALSACTVPAAGKPGFGARRIRGRARPGHPRRAGRPQGRDHVGRRDRRRDARQGHQPPRGRARLADGLDGQQPGRHADDGAGDRGPGRDRGAGVARYRVERAYVGTFSSALEMAGAARSCSSTTPASPGSTPRPTPPPGRMPRRAPATATPPPARPDRGDGRVPGIRPRARPSAAPSKRASAPRRMP